MNASWSNPPDWRRLATGEPDAITVQRVRHAIRSSFDAPTLWGEDDEEEPVATSSGVGTFSELGREGDTR